MKRIIALRGKGNSGKTTTINLLPKILETNGYTRITGIYQNHGADFLDIYQKNNSKVGITSSGDTYALVKDRLDDLVIEKCDICICACRTFDRSEKGTNAATKSYPDYEVTYLDKTYAGRAEEEDRVNRKDANKLYSLI